MAIFDDSVGLESFMLKANQIAQRLSACHTAEAAHQPTSPANGSPVPEPMQVDTARPFQSRTCSPNGSGAVHLLCFGWPLHQVLPQQNPTSSGEYSPDQPCNFHAFCADCSTIHSSPIRYCLCPGRLGLLGQLHLPSRLHLPRRRHARELWVETINGKPLGRGCVKFESPPMKLKIGNLHEEEIKFLVLEGPTVDIILGRPWLILHSPEI